MRQRLLHCFINIFIYRRTLRLNSRGSAASAVQSQCTPVNKDVDKAVKEALSHQENRRSLVISGIKESISQDEDARFVKDLFSYQCFVCLPHCRAAMWEADKTLVRADSVFSTKFLKSLFQTGYFGWKLTQREITTRAWRAYLFDND